MSLGASNMKVLIQNRPTTFTLRGGDTILVERISQGLTRAGFDVKVDVEGREDPRSYDLVHLFNFATPDLTRQLAERAFNAKVPYVVTTLYEDIPKFHNQSIKFAEALIGYVNSGQNKATWESSLVASKQVSACGSFDNNWTARNAAALFSSGAKESAVLRGDYAGLTNVREIHFGHEIAPAVGPELFQKKYGVSDFVFCVGRIESRKNQLMLAKALEDSELTLVFAGGGFTYQPEYEQALRNFKRKGRTIILEKLAPEMLASAYACARVHVLASWYELPGLVSLEAASFGCNVVATENGTISDYLGEAILYCDPSSERSIKNAVLAGYHSKAGAELKQKASNFTWEKTVQATISAYENIVKKKAVSTNKAFSAPTWQLPNLNIWGNGAAPNVTSTNSSHPSAEFDKYLEEGEAAAKEKDLEKAKMLLSQAIGLNPGSARACKALGAVCLAESDVSSAKSWFSKALAIDANEPRALAGMGMCLIMEKKHVEAYPLFVKGLKISPDNLLTLMQLIECSYVLNRFDDLEQFLRSYVAQNPADIEMVFCHAGALYKLGRIDESEALNQRVLAHNPAHLGAGQLKNLIHEMRGTLPSSAGLNALGANPAAGGLSNLRSSIKVESAPTTSAGPATFDYMDRRLSELEDLKHERKYDEVKSACAEIKDRPGIRADQREMASLLFAEASVLTGEMDAASAIYTAVLAGNAKSARAMCGKGAMAANRNAWQEAREWFDQALSISPNYDVALAGRGLCHHYFGEAERAWDCYSRAVRANPENSRALLGVIEIGYQTGKLAEVENAIRAYLEMHPGDLDYLYSLAGCCFAQGKLQEARDEVGKILLFQPNHEKAAELRQAIDERGAGGTSAWHG